jgi:diguanylate cyclase (GGDEF)-like protein
MSNDLLNDVLACPSLPSLPGVAVRVLELTSDPDVSMNEIAKTVQQDQALSGKVLKTVNSSFYGLTTRCGSIDRAMGYLGLNTVKSLVLGFSLVEVTAQGDEESGFDPIGHWRRAVLGSTSARVLSERLRVADRDEVFTAALFQDIGMLAMFTSMKDRYGDVIAGVAHSGLCAVERAEFGFDHAQSGAALARKWNLPAHIADAIEHHHDGDASGVGDASLVRIVALATLIADMMSVDDPAPVMRRVEELLDEWFPKHSIDFEDLIGEVTTAAETLAGLFNTDIGAFRDPRQLVEAAQERELEHQITMQRETEALARQATTDGLTGVANRKRFDALIGDCYERFRTEGAPFSVLFLDADRFKSVNDTHGHAAGDAVLIELARRAERVIGERGLVCRYGGEEFGIVLLNVGSHEAAKLAETLRASVSGEEFDLRGVEGAPETLRVTVSIGVSGTDAGDLTRLVSGLTIVKEADECVYLAKESGRDNVQLHGAGRGEPDGVAAGSMRVLPRVRDESDTALRILLIEDDALAATLLSTLLKRRGNHEVEWIDSGSEGLARIRSSAESGTFGYDLVVCDLDLPGVSGLEILRHYAGIGLERVAPFYVLTANQDDWTRREAVGLGASVCVTKAEFTADIARWLGVFSGERDGANVAA